MSTFVVDIDGTLCKSQPGCDYSLCDPITEVIDKVNEAYDNGHHIILYTARGMRSNKGVISQIHVNVLPTLKEWLNRHNVKYHHLQLGKPWGDDVWYIDDRALRPDEFITKDI